MAYSESERGEIRADIEALYRVGRIKMPEEAEKLAEVTERLGAVVDSMNSRAAQLGDPLITQNVMAVCARVNNALVKAVSTMNDVAVGLVHVADDFVARDDYAAEVFRGLGDGLTQGPVDQATVPPALDEEQLLHEGDGDDYTAVPDYETPEDELADRDEQLGDDQDDVEDLNDLEGIVR